MGASPVYRLKPSIGMFVPAKLEDNPYLDHDSYDESLAQLDPVTRAQLRGGDWRIRPEGNLFRRQWFDTVDPMPRITRSVRAWDLATTEEGQGDDPDWTVGVKISADESGMMYLSNLVRFRARPKEVEATIKQTAELDGRKVWIRMEQDLAAAGRP